jgi:hypothetical protein
MKAITISLAFLSISCIIALAWVLGMPAPIDPRVARLETDLKEARQTISQLRRELAEKPAPSSLRTMTSAPTIDAPSAAGSAANASPTATPIGGQAGALREMLKNPAMRAMMEQQQAMQVEASYARLMDQLQLTDEEKAHFKKLLVDKQKVETDLGMKMLDPNLSPDQRKQIVAQAEKNKKTYDDAIKTFLNNDSDWNNFQAYEDTKPERTSFDAMGRTLFASSSEPLTQQQEQILMNTMTQVRKSPTPEQAALSKSLQDPSQINDININRLLEMMRQNNQRILEQTSTTMTPGQLRTLEQYLAQNLKNTETGLKMGSIITGNQK